MSEEGEAGAPLCGEIGTFPKQHLGPGEGRVLCSCGCVPPALSLFEMAALRKEARERKKKQEEEEQKKKAAEELSSKES